MYPLAMRYSHTGGCGGGEGGGGGAATATAAAANSSRCRTPSRSRPCGRRPCSRSGSRRKARRRCTAVGRRRCTWLRPRPTSATTGSTWRCRCTPTRTALSSSLRRSSSACARPIPRGCTATRTAARSGTEVSSGDAMQIGLDVVAVIVAHVGDVVQIDAREASVRRGSRHPSRRMPRQRDRVTHTTPLVSCAPQRDRRHAPHPRGRAVAVRAH